MSRVGERLRGLPAGPLGPLGDLRFNSRVLREAGVTTPTGPSKTVRALLALRAWGISPATGIVTAAIRRGDEVALLDERGQLSFNELDRRSNALARAFAAAGVGAGSRVAIMCRNHRGFVDATLACAKAGADVLYLNTGFAGPQLAGVVENERPAALVYDREFSGLLSGPAQRLSRFVAWPEGGERTGAGREEDPLVEDLIAGGDGSPLDPPGRSSRFVILTSGTTGTPKGAQRGQPGTLGPLAAILARLPLLAEERTMIAAPLFHGLGFVHLTLGLTLRSTYVLRRRFDAEETLRATAESEASALVVVPVMMQRILELPEETIRRYDLSRLRVTAVGGSALPPDVATRWMDAFGDNLYNVYGSTEAFWATIATPQDLRAAPGSTGFPPRGTTVKLVDEAGQGEVPVGTSGRIFVGNAMRFEGYTGGGGKAQHQGLVATGDVGHLDGSGRLFVDGRDDEMIVSGGENVFPREVEDLLAAHDSVRDVAVVGIDDEEFGQRLGAFVVVRPGAAISADDLKAHVKSNLAGYKVPRDIVFLDELPRNASGKVLKRELA